MKHIFKLMIPLLIFAILFTSCTTDNSDKTLEQINTYIAENELNTCLQYVKELDAEDKSKINDEVCNIVINKFIELRDKTKIDETNIFDLSLIDTAFTEKCQKLWNIISEFAIDDNYELYYECINLRYYSEMIDYTRYCDIYSLAKIANNSKYLDDLSTALYEYENNGNNATLKTLSKKIDNINYNKFDPQQHLVSDFRNAHETITKALKDLNEGFNTNDSATVATAINTLKNALSDILYITDTLSAVNSMQQTIYNKISTENIYAPFNSEIQITKHEYTTGMSFSLDMIFGGVEDITIDETTKTTEESTKSTTDKISLDDTIKIAVNAINQTKAFTGNVDITLTQIQDIKLSEFKSNSAIVDADNIIESQLNQSLKQSNGTIKNTFSFSNGTSGKETLNSFIPPNNKSATLNPDAVSKYNCIKGSGGYIITLVLKSELIEYGDKTSNIGSIVNTFSIENSNDIKDFDTAYSETKITIIVNNNGKLIEMGYIINGISNCIFTEKDTMNEYKTQFIFKNNYKYEFKY